MQGLSNMVQEVPSSVAEVVKELRQTEAVRSGMLLT